MTQETLDNWSVSSDIYLTLQAFVALLHESASGEQITKKAVNAVVQRVENKLEDTLEKSLSKVSTMVKSFVANQKDLQGLVSDLSEATATSQSLMQDLGNSTREALATLNQLTTTVNSCKEALLGTSTVI